MSSTNSKEGYLTKLGEKVQNWKRRYFVLEHDTLIYYTDSTEKGSNKFKGKIEIKGARVLLLDSEDYGKANVFGITPMLSNRTYVLSADTPSERDAWMQALTEQGVVYSKRGMGGETKVDPRTLKEGFLVKQGATIRNWKRRYCALFPHTLTYFKHKGDVVPAGEVPLRAGAEVDIESDVIKDKEKVPFAFSVTPLLPGSTRKYFFIAENEAELKSWVEAIKGVSLLRHTDFAGNTVENEASALFVAIESEDDYYDESKNSEAQTESSKVGNEVVILKEGWLKKQGGFLKTWKRRWFVLESTPTRRVLRYFKAIEDVQPVGEIPLVPSCIVHANPNSSNETCTFSISPEADKGRTYYCVAESVDEMNYWIDVIKMAIKGHVRAMSKEGQERVRSPSVSKTMEEKLALLSVTRTITSQFKVHPQSTREGWLNLLLQKKNLSKKYVILTWDSLFIFDNKPSSAELKNNRRISLLGATFQQESLDSFPTIKAGTSRFLFSVAAQNEEKEIFATETLEDSEAWIAVISKQIKDTESKARLQLKSAREGFLTCLNMQDMAWTRGYYVLPDKSIPVLQYFKTQADSAGEPFSGLSLAGASIQLLPNDRYNRPFCFSVAGPNNTWILSADTHQEMDQWVEAMIAAEEEPSSDEEGLR